MKRTGIVKAALSIAAAAVLAMSLTACGGNSEQPAEGEAAKTELSGAISTNGSTSMEKVMGSLGESFMAANPGVTITYDATGSGTGIECATQGTTDIGLASRALKDSETGLDAITVALDGIAIVVNPASGVTDLSLEQVTDIFNGTITNWSEVGGEDLEIACIGREAGSGTRDGFESVTDTKDACVLSQELTSTGAVLTAVASSSNAIGYASLSAVEGKSDISVITVNGVACSEDSVKDGSYAIQRPFNMIIKQGAELSPQVQAFIDYATSVEAAELIRAAGAIPLV